MYVKAGNLGTYSTRPYQQDCEFDVRIDAESNTHWKVDVMTNNFDVHLSFTSTEAEALARGILAALETEVMA